MEDRGYTVAGQNYRTRHGELDFVVRNDGTLVVVEVKLRRGTGFGDPLEAVNLRKQRGCVGRRGGGLMVRDRRAAGRGRRERGVAGFRDRRPARRVGRGGLREGPGRHLQQRLQVPYQEGDRHPRAGQPPEGGAAFDLAMAPDILAASGGLPFTSLEDVEVVGEHSCDGGCAGFGAPSA